MAELKTQPTQESVDAFIDAVDNDRRREDCRELVKLMRDVTGAEPQMWGPSIVGFGRYHYRYSSGREAEWFLTGFSPRKRNLTLYLMSGFDGYDALMANLGKHKTGKSCLYINRLSDLDPDVLRELVVGSVETMRRDNDVEGSDA